MIELILRVLTSQIIATMDNVTETVSTFEIINVHNKKTIDWCVVLKRDYIEKRVWFLIISDPVLEGTSTSEKLEKKMYLLLIKVMHVLML